MSIYDIMQKHKKEMVMYLFVIMASMETRFKFTNSRSTLRLIIARFFLGSQPAFNARHMKLNGRFIIARSQVHDCKIGDENILHCS